MLFTTVLIGIVIALIVKWILDRRQQQSVFKRAGLLGPEPHLLYGNFFEIARDGQRKTFMDWSKKFGKTFGFYEGNVPVLATADTNLLKQVLVKDFSSFHSRKIQKFSYSRDSIVSSEGERWKGQRMILSPVFSTRGIKEMSSIVTETVTKLMDLFDKRATEGKPFDIMEDFQKLTLSAIANCGFGLDVDAVHNPDDIFLKKCQEVFKYKPSALARSIYMISFVIPPIFTVFKKLFPSQFGFPASWFYATAKAIIESRKGEATKRKDFVQLMLQAEEQEQPQDVASLEVSMEDTETEKKRSGAHSTRAAAKNGKSLSMEEKQASCMAFLLAGFETTSTTLAYIAYHLALHPDIQEKLVAEIEEHFPDDSTLPDYLSVQKLTYMDQVFCETLRLHPPAQIVQTRRCYSDTSIGGVPIKKGSEVQVLVDVLHRDPEHWGPEDTGEFVPDRFLPERKKERDALAWMPFGSGPRNCIGMRFAIMEVKLTLVGLLKKFRILRCDETQVPIKIDNRGLARPLDGVKVKLEYRQ